MKFKLIFKIGLTLLFVSCNSNPLNIKPVHKNLNIEFINLDSIMKMKYQREIEKNINYLNKKYDEIINYQFNYCLGIKTNNDSNFIKSLNIFEKDPYVIRLENTIDKKFNDLNFIKTNILKGFLFLNHHFKSIKIPRAIFFTNSFFSSNVYVGQKDIAIGLERYLGPNEQVIIELPSNEFHSWIKDRMLKSYLERDVLFTWIMTHLVKEDNENFASQMIRWGKILYFTEASFPNMKKNLILRYSINQIAWCEKNEKNIWKYLIKHKLLFTKNERIIANFMNDAPFTTGLDNKSPDRVAQYIGWKMIHSYMNKNPNLSLKKLISIPYNEIMKNYEKL